MSFRLFTNRHQIILLAAALFFSGFGCNRIKRIFVKAPPEEHFQESYTTRLLGYEQTVSVKGTSEEIFEYVSNPENLQVGYLKIGEDKGPILEERKPMDIGGTMPVSIGFMGAGVKAKIMVIRTDGRRHWLVIDNPYSFVLQRWDFEPVKEGTELKIKMAYEVPEEGMAGQLGRMVDFAEMGKSALGGQMIKNGVEVVG